MPYKDKEEARKSFRKRRKYRNGYLNEIKEAKGCQRCGVTNPVVLEFHHVRGKKDKNLSDLAMRCASIERIKTEVDKCEVVCANCHRIIHHEEKIGV